LTGAQYACWLQLWAQ